MLNLFNNLINPTFYLNQTLNIKKKLLKINFDVYKILETVKVVSEESKIVIEEEYEDCTIEELAEELPECQPRYPFDFSLI